MKVSHCKFTGTRPASDGVYVLSPSLKTAERLAPPAPLRRRRTHRQRCPPGSRRRRGCARNFVGPRGRVRPLHCIRRYGSAVRLSRPVRRRPPNSPPPISFSPALLPLRFGNSYHITGLVARLWRAGLCLVRASSAGKGAHLPGKGHTRAHVLSKAGSATAGMIHGSSAAEGGGRARARARALCCRPPFQRLHRGAAADHMDARKQPPLQPCLPNRHAVGPARLGVGRVHARRRAARLHAGRGRGSSGSGSSHGGQAAAG